MISGKKPRRRIRRKSLVDFDRKKIYLAEKRKLDRRIDHEIATFFKGDATFLPDEYRKLRLAGKTRKQIGYDECHVWR